MAWAGRGITASQGIWGTKHPGQAMATYCGAGTSTINPSDPHTFSSVPIGTPSNDRYILVVLCVGNDSVSSPYFGIDLRFGPATLTVGGVSTNYVTERESSVGGSPQPRVFLTFAITSEPITTGTTADIVLTGFTEANIDAMNITVYALTGISSKTASDTFGASGEGDTTSNTSSGFIIPAKGCAVAAVSSTLEGNITFTRATENYDADIGDIQFASANVFHTGSSANTDELLVSWSGGASDAVGWLAASWAAADL